ncbi:MAG TPA: hypothetical protein VNZ55_05610 [Thermomicrobiales bacterium]|nr:hypothetical protein [Thermomicrobiales bacterium]
MGEQIEMLSRRRLVGIGAMGVAAGAMLSLPAMAVNAQDASGTPEANVTTDGIGGGGSVPNGGGAAQFALTAFALPNPDGGEPAFHGSFTLKDESDPNNPIDMASQFFNQITAYSTDHPNARQIIGWANVNSGGPYPFLLQVEDVGPAGSGEDTFNLVFGNAALPFMHTDQKVCDCGGFSYSLKGTVTVGDIVLFPLGS